VFTQQLLAVISKKKKLVVLTDLRVIGGGAGEV